MKYLLAFMCISFGPIGIANEHSSINQKPFEISNEVSFVSKDNVQLFADVYQSRVGKSAPLIMLFHQGGGDARGEYASLIPVLMQDGYHVIAVDLRTGGNRFGSENRTVVNLGEVKYGYCDTYPDLEATLDYAVQQGFSGNKVAWGSSFSASLVFQLASKRGEDLSAILAFSPASGGPMLPCKPDIFVQDITTPTLVLRPESEMQRQASQQQFEFFKQHGMQTYISPNGVHGSSMLNKTMVKGSVADIWHTVLNFIKQNTNK